MTSPTAPYCQIINLLKTHQISYEEISHAKMTRCDQEEEMTGLPSSQGAKSLLLKLKKKDIFALIVLPGDKQIDTKKCANILGEKKIRMALPNEIEEQMGCEAGACHPFGSLNSIQTIFDLSMETLEGKKVAFNPGIHTKSILLAYEDLKNLVSPEMADTSQDIQRM